MHLSQVTFVIIALTRAALGAVEPPSDLGDGIWAGSLDGETNWKKLADLPEDIVSAARAGGPAIAGSIDDRNGTSIDKRNDYTGCSWHTVLAWEYVSAFQTLWALCSNGFPQPARTSVAVVAGNTYWYLCNYRYNDAYPCYTNDMEITLHSVEYACGDFITGWDYLSTPDISFGVENTVNGLCW